MIDIKRILCPTDLSHYSENAVRYALALSRAHDAELILLHCTANPEGKEELLDTLLQNIESPGARCRLIVAPADHVDEAIMTQAQVERADLIVMRSRRRPHRAALLGSTAEFGV